MIRRDGQILVYSLGPIRQDDQGVVDKGYWMKKSGPDDYGTGAWDVPLNLADRPRVRRVAIGVARGGRGRPSRRVPAIDQAG